MRQYVGARYVPKFMGTYDATQVYEALCVVDNGMGTSYISKIPTPANTPLTDSTYWQLYGASSGAIISLQDQINDMNDGSVPGSLQNQINVNTADIADLKAKNNINKILFVGDSYNTIYDIGWDTEMANLLGLTSADYFRVNVGGTGFTTSPSWIDAINNRLSLITDKDLYSDVVVISGGNDKAASYAALYSGMSDFKSYIATNFPNAKIHVGSVGWSGLATDNGLFRNSANNYIAAAQALGIHYLRNVEYILHWKPYIRDNTAIIPTDYYHPTENGVRELGKGITQAFLTGACTVKYADTITLTPDGTNCDTITGTWVVSMVNGTTIIESGNTSIHIPISKAGGSGIASAGTFSSNLFNPVSVNNVLSGLKLADTSPYIINISLANGVISFGLTGAVNNDTIISYPSHITLDSLNV